MMETLNEKNTKNEMGAKVLSGIMGLVTADALGVPVEFQSRAQLREHPVTGMREYGTYMQPRGTWSDDSTMTLCLMESLTKRRDVDVDDIFRRFAAWADTGYMTPFGVTFDMGHATMEAIARFERGVPPLECGGQGAHSNGNGSLMRILPMAFFAKSMEPALRFSLVHDVSRLTHGHLRSRMACGFYVEMAAGLLDGLDKWAAYRRAIDACQDYYGNLDVLSEQLDEPGEVFAELGVYQRVFDGQIAALPEEEIRSSGYVVDTLEAALWCLLGTESYEECVLRAVNLGQDTDTVGAVAGGLAGLVYGYDAIPEEWKAAVVKREIIEEMCCGFAEVCAKQAAL